jgi:taurine dioxygenase
MTKAVTASRQTSVEVEQLGAYLGAEIRGVDLSKPLDDAAFQAVHDGLIEHEVIVIPDQDITVDQQMAFGRRFGELSVHPFSPNLDDKPELIVLDYDESNPAFATDVWHSDETFRVEPPMGTILRSVLVPKVGGDTMWASMSAAYDGLSDRIKNQIDGLEAIFDIGPFRRLFPETPEGIASLRHMEDLCPRQTHPVVRVHPVSGRKVLFVNPQFTVAIKDMSERESRALLDILFHQSEIPEYQFRLHWKPNTVVVWDNRSTQHYAVHDYYPQRRKMERVTIKGDRPFGIADSRIPIAPPRALRRAASDAGAKRRKGPVRQFERILAEET